MRLTFNGAARIVTGSCYLLEAAGEKILIDCGMFQGSKEVTGLNYQSFRFNPKEISHLLLTHAHIDHSGLIPKLVREGFRGKIIATKPTVDLVKVMLEDAAHVNEDETLHENKRRLRVGLPPRNPLYTLEDVKASFKFFSPVGYDAQIRISDRFAATFRNAGHILGSSIIELEATESGETTKVVFSGDLGQWGTPLLNDPTIIEEADYVLVESTYGDRVHEDTGIRQNLLGQEVKDTYSKGGKLMIPSFAVERTQELLYYFHRLVSEGDFPAETVFLDSPLAINATEVFKKNMDYFSPSLRKEFKNPFTFSGLKYLKSAQDSQTLNDYEKPCVIIAGNGMCTAGRIRYHLKYNLWKSQNTLLFVGYQAEGSLGRVILDGSKMVRMMGMEVAVNAKVDKIESFSSHSDKNELLKWVKGFGKKPKRVFVVHGEEPSSEAFASTLGQNGFKTLVPELGQSVAL